MTINQKTIDATIRLIKHLNNSDTVAQAVYKLVQDENHVSLSALECLPMDDIITAKWGDRKAAIAGLTELLETSKKEKAFSAGMNDFAKGIRATACPFHAGTNRDMAVQWTKGWCAAKSLCDSK